MDFSDQAGIGNFLQTENDVLSHSIELFKPVSQEVSVIRGRVISLRPLISNDAGPHEFMIQSSGRNYILPSHTRLYVKCKIVKEDGSDCGDADKYSVVNFFGPSMFKQIGIEINGSPISELTCSSSNYKAYIEGILSYGRDALHSHVSSGIYEDELPNAFDDFSGKAKSGYLKRQTYVTKSKELEMMFPLSSDFLMSDRLIPPGLDIKIKLEREKDSFSICSATDDKNYRIKILDMKLYIRQVELHPNVVRLHEQKLSKEPATLPIVGTNFKYFQIPKGNISVNIPNLFNGNLPNKIVVGLVNAKAFDGDIKLNPYNFQHFNLNKASLRVNGQPIPSEEYTPDFANGNYIRLYNDLFYNIGIYHSNIGISMTKELYKGGMCLQAYDLTPDGCNGFHNHKFGHQTGVVELDYTFSKALEQPTYIVVYSTRDTNVIIDKNKGVIVYP